MQALQVKLCTLWPLLLSYAGGGGGITGGNFHNWTVFSTPGVIAWIKWHNMQVHEINPVWPRVSAKTAPKRFFLGLYHG
jgi:hypothetical protein